MTATITALRPTPIQLLDALRTTNQAIALAQQEIKLPLYLLLAHERNKRLLERDEASHK